MFFLLKIAWHKHYQEENKMRSVYPLLRRSTLVAYILILIWLQVMHFFLWSMWIIVHVVRLDRLISHTQCNTIVLRHNPNIQSKASLQNYYFFNKRYLRNIFIFCFVHLTFIALLILRKVSIVGGWFLFCVSYHVNFQFTPWRVLNG